VLLWNVGLAVAGLLMHWAMGNANSVVLSSGLAAAAVAIPLSLLGYTMRRYGDAFNSHILVPAIGPIVIAVLILGYVDHNRRVEDAYSAQLIPAELLILSDVKWAVGASSSGGAVSGHVVNRSPHKLIGLSLEVALYGGSEKLGGAVADAKLDVAPGQQINFSALAPDFSAAGIKAVPCVRQEALPPPNRKHTAGLFECFYRVAETRGEEVFF
jgi:hypothetical protein